MTGAFRVLASAIMLITASASCQAASVAPIIKWVAKELENAIHEKPIPKNPEWPVPRPPRSPGSGSRMPGYVDEYVAREWATHKIKTTAFASGDHIGKNLLNAYIVASFNAVPDKADISKSELDEIECIEKITPSILRDSFRLFAQNLLGEESFRRLAVVVEDVRKINAIALELAPLLRDKMRGDEPEKEFLQRSKMIILEISRKNKFRELYGVLVKNEQAIPSLFEFGDPGLHFGSRANALGENVMHGSRKFDALIWDDGAGSYGKFGSIPIRDAIIINMLPSKMPQWHGYSDDARLAYVDAGINIKTLARERSVACININDPDDINYMPFHLKAMLGGKSAVIVVGESASDRTVRVGSSPREITPRDLFDKIGVRAGVMKAGLFCRSSEMLANERRVFLSANGTVRHKEVMAALDMIFPAGEAVSREDKVAWLMFQIANMKILPDGKMIAGGVGFAFLFYEAGGRLSGPEKNDNSQREEGIDRAENKSDKKR